MYYGDISDLSKEDREEALLGLVRDGLIAVAASPEDGTPIFFPIEMATDEMLEFTKLWLEFPHFEIDS